MRLLLGKQIVLKEFMTTDLVISWVDELVPGATSYLIGNEKGFIYFTSNSEDIQYGSSIDFVHSACGKMAVLCSEKPLRWETILRVKEEGATFLAVFTRVDKFSDLLLTKSVCWGCTCEFKLPIALVARSGDFVHYQLSVPNQNEDSVVVDTTATVVFDIDVLESESGLSFMVKSSAWNQS